jgi:glutamine synthetase
MSDAKKIIDIIKEKEIQFVDLRFTDPRGKMQHVSQHVSTIDEKSLAEGFMFDGSSIDQAIRIRTGEKGNEAI